MTDICNILKNSKTIAVVGISRDETRTSRWIADILENKGYSVVGVNPAIESAGNITVYKNLKEIPFEIDIVDIFRKSEDIPFLIDDILAAKPKICWLQLGIRNDEAVKPLIEAGITVIQDKCIKIELDNCGL